MICPRCLYDLTTPEKGYEMNWCNQCGLVWSMGSTGILSYLVGSAETPTERYKVIIPEGTLPVFLEYPEP